MNSPFFLSILTVLISCSGQNTSQTTVHAQDNLTSTIAKGDTVKELGNNIMVVYQDKKNNFWYGSWETGLYRYDGKTILHYTTKHGLSYNRIDEIKEDKWGNIYFNTSSSSNTSGSINKFDRKNFTTLSVTSNSDNQWKLAPDDLWFKGALDSGHVYRYDGKSLFSLKFPKHYMDKENERDFPKKPWGPYDVYYIYKDSKGNIWFGTANFGVCRYDGKSHSWLYEDHLTNVPNGGSFGIRSIIEDTKGKYWFCNNSYRYTISADSTKENGNVLVKYDKEKGIDNLKATDGGDRTYFMSAVEDNDGDLWLCTYKQGVWRYDGESTTHYSVKDGAKEIMLFCIYKDNQGGLWLGTHENGAYKFNGQTFERFKP